MRYVSLIGFALLLIFAQSMVSCRADKNKINKDTEKKKLFFEKIKNNENDEQ